MKIYRITAALLTLVIMAMANMSVAQNLNNSNLTSSAYNRYGYGRLGSRGNTVTRSMGDVGLAVRSSQYTTLSNPASLTAIDTLTMIFTVGLDAQFDTYREGDNTKRNWDAGFSYMSFQMPLWRNFAMSLSLTPYSMVGYNYGTSSKTDLQSPTVSHDTLAYASTHSGVGGINNFMMGLGWRALRTKRMEANLGVNVGWLFGTIQHDGILATSSQSTSTYLTYGADIRGLFLEVGAQYTYHLDASRSITLGGTFSPKLNLSANTQSLKYSSDTILVTDRFRSATKLPSKWGVGLSYNIARKLTIAAEFETTQWSQIAGLDPELQAAEGIFNDTQRAALGAEWQPKTMTNSIWKASRYHAGFSTQSSYLKVNGSTLREVSANLGISMPVNKRSFLDFSVGYSALRPSSGLVREDYITLSLGITFNEMMFFRNKLR